MKITRRQLRKLITETLLEYRIKPTTGDMSMDDALQAIAGGGPEYSAQASELAASLGYDTYLTDVDEYQLVPNMKILSYMSDTQVDNLMNIKGKSISMVLQYDIAGVVITGQEGWAPGLNPDELIALELQIANKEEGGYPADEYGRAHPPGAAWSAWGDILMDRTSIHPSDELHIAIIKLSASTEMSEETAGSLDFYHNVEGPLLPFYQELVDQGKLIITD